MSETSNNVCSESAISQYVFRPIESATTEVLKSSWMLRVVAWIQTLFFMQGIPKEYHPTAETILILFYIIILTVAWYFRSRGRRRMAHDLKRAEAQLTYLQEKLLAEKQDSKKTVRIFMDGAFDMMHYGHMNAFRLGRSLGTHLIVGVNSDESIIKCKGPPLMKDKERVSMVKACKFVDEVLPGCPYIMNEEYLNSVIDKYKVDYVIHGDDPCIVNGKDVYETAKKAGKYRSIPRTEGVSTTDIVGRMLLMTKDHHFPSNENEILGQTSRFLTTSHMLRLFSAGIKAPLPTMKVIYMDGAFDMFHCGHVALLQEARKLGDYLIVGIHSDVIVNRMQGQNLPLMNLHERILSVLGCRFVDDVLIDAPYHITSEMVDRLKISVVVRSTGAIDQISSTDEDRFSFPKEVGIIQTVLSPSDFNLASIIQRIHENQNIFEAKYERKIKAEQEYHNAKYGSENRK